MPDQRSTRQEIEQARKHPLNQHCLKLMEKEKVPRHDLMVGAPELLYWALEQGIVELMEPFREDLERVVGHLNQGNPQAVTKYLVSPLEGGEGENPEIQEALQAKTLKQAAVAIIDKLHQMLLEARGDEYQPTIAPRL